MPNEWREGNRATYLDLIRPPHPPHHAAEITETVNGNDGSLLKGRGEECARQMRAMMLDKVNRSALALTESPRRQASRRPARSAHCLRHGN